MGLSLIVLADWGAGWLLRKISPPVFIDVPGHPDYRYLNPEIGGHFFTHFKPATAINPFLKRKPANTKRVVVLGGSSAYGFPYQPFHSFSHHFRRLALHHFPETPTEVINLAMTAINSHQYVALLDSVLEIKPDLILIYGGHNEFYGAIGAGALSMGSIVPESIDLLLIRLQQTNLYQLMTHLLPKNKLGSSDRTLMASRIRNAEISPKGSLHGFVERQFGENVTDIITRTKKSGAHVVISTIGSNLISQKPFSRDSVSIGLFRQGQYLLAQNDTALALDAFLAAKDADRIPFRAPEAMSNRILEVQSPLTRVVDGARAMQYAAPSLLPDSTIYTDHLHPHWRAHRTLAHTFFATCAPLLYGADVPNNDSETPKPSISEGDSLYAALSILKLNSDAPFVSTVEAPLRQRGFQQTLKQLKKQPGASNFIATAIENQSVIFPIYDAISSLAFKKGDFDSYLSHTHALSYSEPLDTAFYMRILEQFPFTTTYNAHLHDMLLFASSFHSQPRIFMALGVQYRLQTSAQHSHYWLKKALALNPDNKDILFQLIQWAKTFDDNQSLEIYTEEYRKAILKQLGN